MKRSKHFKLRPAFIARPHKSVNERGQRTITLQSLPALYHPFPPFYEQIDELMASTSSKEFTGASSYLIQAIVGSFYFMMPKFCTIWVLNSRGFWGLPSSVSKLGIFFFFFSFRAWFTSWYPKFDKRLILIWWEPTSYVLNSLLLDLKFPSKLTAIQMKGY